MPIKSLVERMRLPRLGVIRLGVKERTAGGKEYPKEVPYFVLPEELRGVHGEQPTRLPILFPSDDPERILQADYIRYQGKLLTLKCDGETFTELPPGGGEQRGACRKPSGQPCPCGARATGRLSVIVLDGPMGIYQVVLGGEQRIADLASELAIFRATLGRLTKVLFWLERVPTEIQVKKPDGSRLARTGWPVHLRCDFTANQAMHALKVDVLGVGQQVKALPAAIEDEHEVVDEDESPAVVAAPGESTPPVAAPVVEPDVAPPGGLLSSAWTVERLFNEAKRLGLGPQTFRQYLASRFRCEVDALPPDACHAVGEELAAVKDAGAWKAQVFMALKAASK